MHPKRLDDSLAVDGQITVADVAALAAQGYRSIVCNRPDAEGPGQTPYADIAQAARAAGLQARHIPIVSGTLPATAIAQFADALETLPKPVFAYCRSGTRSTYLWAGAQLNMGNRATHDIINSAASVGYDVSPLLRR
jgi:sulfide:quinone oxidoreductase